MDEHHWSEDHLIASTAVLAGGNHADQRSRDCQDRGNHTLYTGCCHDRNAQTMVFSTGIFVSLDSPEGGGADPGSESGGALPT